MAFLLSKEYIIISILLMNRFNFVRSLKIKKNDPAKFNLYNKDKIINDYSKLNSDTLFDPFFESNNILEESDVNMHNNVITNDIIKESVLNVVIGLSITIPSMITYLKLLSMISQSEHIESVGIIKIGYF
tara:strand:+ start:166 stop:555 length:390 start_codon:yes stop_codon:yes gene_type:complete